ncbi:CHAP domain-containing protein [Parasphingorhabdus sp. SCSIO 66989]|uniref:CHAP domain-containing protein n=2 Tax=Alterisphingorhabdus coralli TaxID=3071408 RepID=A0AA97I2R2_9SPHN|nr:CHAP domain-containing protein [Parasphingorhabdus sp. SCSIO 66989]WOE76680.1 CHAP domain-containing protein [Parasphingorhabdus sp. SCSIO 66989]
MAILVPMPAAANGDGYLQCVPYARQQSGISIYGDAHTWWGQAAKRYARGKAPAVGAVMAFQPTGRMRLGHVAAVSAIIDDRTILLDHANWSPINGRRGQIERDVKAIDVSPNNDWSEVRVWYAPISDLGTTRYPVHGFIYNAAPGEEPEAPQRQAPQRVYAMDMTRPDKAPAPKADLLGDLLGKLDIGQVE